MWAPVWQESTELLVLEQIFVATALREVVQLQSMPHQATRICPAITSRALANAFYSQKMTP